MRFKDLPVSSRAIIVATVAVAIAAGKWGSEYWIPIPIWQLGVAAVITCLLAYVQIPLTEAKGRMSLGFAGCLAVVVVWGPADGGLVALLGGIAGNLLPALSPSSRSAKARIDWIKVVFNAANHGSCAVLAGLCYVRMNGGTGVDSVRRSALPMLATTLVFFLVNTLGTAAILASVRGAKVLSVWHENFLWTAPQYLTTASCVLIALWIVGNDTWRWAAVVVLPPLYAVYYSYRMYMEKMRGDLKHISDLNELNNSVIASLATAIDAKDHYTNKHLSRVQCYGLAIAEYLKLPRPECEAIRCAALVHDVGKLGVPENILKKPGKLTAEEHLRIQKHVEIGVEILRPVNFPWPVVEVVAGHHERWDGLGYPAGLRGEDIPIGSRVISVADIFDALTSDRPYRKAMTHVQACDHMRQLSGTHLDPTVVAALMTVLPGCEAKLAAIPVSNLAFDEGVNDSKTINEDVMAQISKANSEFFALYEVSQALPKATDLATTLDAVIAKTKQLVPCVTCVVFLKSGDDELTARAVGGMYSDLLLNMTMKVGEGLSGRVFQGLQPMANAMPTLDVGRKIPPDETVELNSALIVPIRSNGEALGTLSVYDSSYNIYTEDHVRLLVLIADHIANSIYGAQLLHQTEEMALRDPLTGLPNARALTNWMSRRLEDSLHTHEPFALVLIDLDNFKAVNDTLGHLRGDRALRDAARAMEECVRTGDLLTRYAGDEFVLAVQTADFAGVSELCRRLSIAVDGVGNVDGVRIGASAGFAVYPDDGLNAADLIEVADGRMYADKNRRKLQR